jgi:hypothetical protein
MNYLLPLVVQIYSIEVGSLNTGDGGAMSYPLSDAVS